MSDGQYVTWSIRKILWIILAFSCAIMFIVDPYGWIPEPDRTPCKKEDTRSTCTGKIIFFWQKP